MHTQHVHKLLPDYVNGKLENELRETVSLHLRECIDCRTEAEFLRGVFNEVQSAPQDVSPHYFSSIVPRVRQRLERLDRRAWLQNPLFGRIAVPLAAAILVVALFVQLPFNRAVNFGLSLDSSQETFTLDEVSEVLAQQTQPLPLSNLDAQEVAESVLPAGVLEQQIAENVLANEVEFGFDDFPGVPSNQLLNGLSEQEVETLLQRLGERKLL